MCCLRMVGLDHGVDPPLRQRGSGSKLPRAWRDMSIPRKVLYVPSSPPFSKKLDLPGLRRRLLETRDHIV